MTRPLGVILAGGQSRRMGGGDKALLQLDGRTLMQRVIDRLAPQVAALAINANGDPQRYRGFDLPIIADSISGFAGPLAGVLAGLDWAAAKGASHIVTVAADTPFFPTTLVPVLQQTLLDSGQPIVLAATDSGARGRSRHPTFGLWPVSLRACLRDAIGAGTRKVVAWTDAQGCASAIFPSEPFDMFFNINTPKDRERAQELMEKGMV